MGLERAKDPGAVSGRWCRIYAWRWPPAPGSGRTRWSLHSGRVGWARSTKRAIRVSIGLLPPALAADPQFRERFDREARAISQLSHAHICTLHNVGDHGGTAYLVLETVLAPPNASPRALRPRLHWRSRRMGNRWCCAT